MEYFDISATAGTGNSVIRVSTKKNNTSGENKWLKMTVSNGVRSKVVWAEQYYRPELTLTSGSTSLPATGGTLTYNVSSEYDFQFENVPAYVTIRDALNTGVTYASGERISTNVSQDFLFVIDQNYTTSRRTSGNCCLKHFIGNVKQHYTIPIEFEQAAGEEKYIINPGTLYVDYAQNEFVDFDIETNIQDTVQITNSNPTYFSVYPLYGNNRDNIMIATLEDNYTQTRRSTNITLAAGGISETFTVYQYFFPYMELVNGSPSDISCNGAVVEYLFHCDYDYKLDTGGASWITVTDGTSTVVPGQRYSVPAGGTIRMLFNVTSNPNLTSRTGYLHFTIYYVDGSSFGDSVVMRFTQQEFVPTIDIDAPYLTLDYLSTSMNSFDVITNVQGYTVANGNTTNFSVAPTTGTSGTTTHTIGVNQKNTSGSDYTAPVTVSDNLGQASAKTVTFTQWFVPTLITTGSTSVGSSGATLVYTANSHYDYCFTNIPSWITVKDAQGNTYTASQRITAGTKEFRLVVAANMGDTDRDSGNFRMRHWRNNTLQSTNFVSIQISQERNKQMSVAPSSVNFNYNSGETATITVTTNVDAYDIIVSHPALFSVSPSTGTSGTTTHTVTPLTKNTSGEEYNAILTVEAAGIPDNYVSATQAFVPTLTGDTYTADPFGEVMTFTANSLYDIAFTGVPIWFSAITNADDTQTYGEGDIISLEGEMELHFHIKANWGAYSRTSSSLSMVHYINNVVQTDKVDIRIDQDQAEFVDLVPTGWTDAPASGGYKDVVISTTYRKTWYLSSKPEWVAVDPTSGGSTSSAEITVGQNTGSTRTGYVVFQLSGSSAYNSFQVTQSGNDYLDASPSYLDIGQAGDFVQIFVSASTPWSISQPEEDDWYEFDQYSGGSGLTIIGLTIQENDLGGPRLGEATLSDPSAMLPSIVVIYQDG